MSNEANPLVSAIITTMNRPSLLHVALESLCRQLFTDFETIVVNDGGDDPSPVLDRFANRLRVTHISNERNMGVAFSRNRALAVARGRYIAYLDDDDFYYEDHLQLLLAAMLKSGAAVAYTDANKAKQKEENGTFVTVSRRVSWSTDFNTEKLCKSNYIPTLCLMHEKSCLDIAGRFKEHLDRHEDWDLWLRFSRFFTFVHFKTATAEYTMREGAVSLSKDTAAMNRSRLHVRLLGEYLERMPRVEDLAARVQNAKYRRAFSAASSALSVIVHVGGQNPGLAKCLEALVASYPEGAEIILSVDGEPGLAARLDRSIEGDMTIIEHPEPIGRVLAANLAVSKATGKRILFLGQDVLMERACLEAMAQTHDERGGIVTALLRGPGDTLLCGGGVDDSGKLRHVVTKAGNATKDITPVPCANAACMLMDKDLFLRLNGFALRYAPGGYEDADFCLRAMRDADEPALAVPAAVTWYGAVRSGPSSVEALYGASTFAMDWGNESGWVPEREYWVNAGNSATNAAGHEESERFHRARISPAQEGGDNYP